MMRIRGAAKWEDAEATGNVFVAVDEIENTLGYCRVEPSYIGELIPERPMEYKIFIEGEDEVVRQQLLGTAFSRAMLLASETGLNTRIYAECSADDEKQLELFATIGMIDNDALIQMTRPVVGDSNLMKMPAGCIFIVDDLSNSIERNYFMERQVELFGRKNITEWTDTLLARRGMRRMLLANRDGLVGEVVCWIDKNGQGVIEEVYTAPAWRRMGVATFLMEEVRRYFYKNGLNECRLNVRIKMTHMVRTAAALGYRQSNVIMRLPGSDLNAPKGQRK